MNKLETPRWAIVLAPSGRQYFGQVRAIGWDPVAGGQFAELRPAYSYEIHVSENRREIARVVQPVDGILEVEEIHTFAVTVIYLAEGTGTKSLLETVRRYEAEIELRQNQLRMREEERS